MKCPHCLESFHAAINDVQIIWDPVVRGKTTEDKDGGWSYQVTECPACRRFIISLKTVKSGHVHRHIQVYPKGTTRAPVPKEVTNEDKELAADYTEACLVFDDSPKASAALSRRCLQHLLREKVGVKKSDLSKEIDEVLNSTTLPADLAAEGQRRALFPRTGAESGHG